MEECTREQDSGGEMAGGTSAGMGRDGLEGLFAQFKLLRTRRLQNPSSPINFSPHVQVVNIITFLHQGYILIILKI